MKASKQAGFTLVEVMISLLIISVITSVVLLSFHSLYKKKETKHFLETFIQDIYFAQQLAMTTGNRTDIFINNENLQYTIQQQGIVFYRQSFDPSITFERGTLKLNGIRFNSKGNITQSGTIFIRTNNGAYRVVFLLGKGRFYIEKM